MLCALHYGTAGAGGGGGGGAAGGGGGVVPSELYALLPLVLNGVISHLRRILYGFIMRSLARSPNVCRIPSPAAFAFLALRCGMADSSHNVWTSTFFPYFVHCRSASSTAMSRP